MTTTQEVTNGHLPQKGYPLPAKVYQQDELSPADEFALFAGDKASPPPFPVEHPAAPTGAHLPTEEADINSNTFESQISDLPSPEARPSFPTSAYHVPPKLFTPKADSFRNTIPEGWSRTKLPDRCQFDHPTRMVVPSETGAPDAHRLCARWGGEQRERGTSPELSLRRSVERAANELPERCQFMFSDGRQCTMARSDIHPSLCVYHSDREEQLFGDPGERCEAKTLDFPELHSACRDLSTARGVNRALAQVFRMLARGRISRQEAATFAKLGHLLLQSISAARAEGLSEHEQHTSQVVEQQKSVPITPPSPHHGVVPSESTLREERSAHSASRTVSASLELIPEPQNSPAPSLHPDPEAATLKSQISDLSSPDAAPASREDAAPALAALAPQSQAPQNQQLPEIQPQLSQNQHIQKCAT